MRNQCAINAQTLRKIDAKLLHNRCTTAAQSIRDRIDAQPLHNQYAIEIPPLHNRIAITAQSLSIIAQSKPDKRL
jgi:cell fate (sporulation/competence/biofilm development) regulator YmcA (YheA/YmcA/DUF963 family)